MPAAVTTAGVRFGRPRPAPAKSALDKVRAAMVLIVDVLKEAKHDAREAHRRYPFADW